MNGSEEGRLIKRGLVWLCAWSMVSMALAGSGALSWMNQFGGSVNDAGADAIGVDNSGRVVVTGVAMNTNGRSDIVTISYSNAGEGLWTNHFSKGGNADCNTRAMAVSSEGKVFVAGVIYYPDFEQWLTVAYTSAGAPMWTNYYGAPEDAGEATRITVDGAGNVLVTGQSHDERSHFLTIKYSENGTAVWTNRYTGSENGYDRPFGIATDGAGNVIVTGESYSVEGESDFAVIKYSATGEGVWTNRYDGAENSTDLPSAVAADKNGDVFVTGYSIGTNGPEFLTLKYASAGAPIWTNRYKLLDRHALATAMALDASGDVIVTGHSGGTNGLLDYATVKYSSDGVALWTNRYNVPDNYHAYPFAVAVDTNKNVYVTGASFSSADSDSATVAYSGTGVALWTNRYGGAAGGDDQTRAIAVDAAGNAFVTGYSSGSGGAHFYLTLKYSAQESASLNIRLQNQEAVLSWTNAGFVLQAAPEISGTFTSVAGATSPYTNTVTGEKKFFRLKSN